MKKEIDVKKSSSGTKNSRANLNQPKPMKKL